MRRLPYVFLFFAVLVLGTFPVPLLCASEPDVPPEVPGKVVYVPFPVETGPNGMPADWESIPSYTVTAGSMTKTIEGENDSFTFSLAADETTLFLRFTMADKNIVAGMHGKDWWNEDSLEFYLNDTGDIGTTFFQPGVVQVNVNASELETGALSLSGKRFAEEHLDIRGRTFRTQDGWGFEAAVSMEGRTLPKHGAAFGFQAQANGATQKDRNVKLIWSSYDTRDESWKSPALFGTAVYYELGREDVPEPPSRSSSGDRDADVRKEIPILQRPLIRINQNAYPCRGRKIAMAAISSEEPLEWALSDKSGMVKARGMSEPHGPDFMSGETLHIVDFSAYDEAGEGFILSLGDLQSPPINIAANPYKALLADSLAYFYRSRAGMKINPFLGGKDWARDAWYSSDNAVRPFSGTDTNGVEWEGGDYTLDAGKGWFDAGDYGKYTVNGAVAAWTLGNLYEHFPMAAGDGELALPETGNGIPDILDEIRWEMDFLLGMQVPEGEELSGMVHHKLHEAQWTSFPLRGVVSADDRFVFHPSTAATYDMAAAAAQFARLIEPYDKDYARRCLTAAIRAWTAAEGNPEFLYGNIPGSGGGNYDDADVSDERFFAASELFVTTGESPYRRIVKDYLESPEWKERVGNPGNTLSWQQVSYAALLSLAASRRPGFGVRKTAAEDLLEAASAYLLIAEADGYRIPLTNYPWGSNSVTLNKGILMAVAAELTGEKETAEAFRETAAGILDYLLGRNALAQSYITGYGIYDSFAPHHRFWAAEPKMGYPYPPPGVLVGGPNAAPSDEPGLAVRGRSAAKRYADHNESFSTNEVAVNWNAPLAWMAAWASQMAGNE